jgi:hypothetical protein
MPDRKYCWAPLGFTPGEDLPMVHSNRWSILTAYTVDGYIAREIFQGAYTAERVNTFLRNTILPHNYGSLPAGRTSTLGEHIE